MPEAEKRSWVRHKIKSGETLSTIAQKYHTNISILKNSNKLKGNTIRAGRHLLIPVPQNEEHLYTLNNSVSTNQYTTKRRKNSAAKENLAEYKMVSHVVKNGETLGGIAERYSTRARKIRSWNGLYYGQHIYPKQNLKIYVPKGRQFTALASAQTTIKQQDESSGTYYTVRSGDTLWDISKIYNVSISTIKKMNKMTNSKIRPGDRLKVQIN